VLAALYLLLIQVVLILWGHCKEEVLDSVAHLLLGEQGVAKHFFKMGELIVHLVIVDVNLVF